MQPVQPESVVTTKELPAYPSPTILVCMHLVAPYLSTHCRRQCGLASASLGLICSFPDLPRIDSPPVGVHKRRRCLFGRPSKAISVTHKTPHAHQALPFVWPFLTPLERSKLCAASPVCRFVATLRIRASQLVIERLLDARPPPAGEPFDRTRSLLLACALLRFRFNYADLVRWLGGDYAPAPRDWAALRHRLKAVDAYPPLPGYPPVDSDLALRVLSEGVPLQGTYSCRYSDVVARNSYNNHPPLAAHRDDVWTKLQKEEDLSFHLLFPRILWRVIPGIHLSFMTWVTRRGKGALSSIPARSSPPTTREPRMMLFRRRAKGPSRTRPFITGLPCSVTGRTFGIFGSRIPEAKYCCIRTTSTRLSI